MTFRRVRSVLAVAVFLGANIGAPVVDAAWYHSGDASHTVPHIESTDNPDCHTEDCSLGVQNVPPAQTADIANVPGLSSASSANASLLAPDVPLDRTPPPAPDSRAPPV